MDILKGAFLLVTLSFLFMSSLTSAQDINACLQARVVSAQNDSLTIADLKASCLDEQNERDNSSLLANIFNLNSALPFKPYKKSFVSIGSMKNADGSNPFSGDDSDLKFQFSVKYQIFHSEEQGVFDFLAPLHFGYTQLAWWDIAEESAPFAELNYNPELFWQFNDYCQSPFILQSDDEMLGSCDSELRFSNIIGAEHQSNGRNGLESRSWNRAYWKSGVTTADNRFSADLKVWHVINKGEENSDITDFLGNTELTLGINLGSRYLLEWVSTKGHHQSSLNTKLDLIYKPSDRFNPRLFLTYYNGYGESLISYNVKTESLRLGFDFPIE
jgi:phospholipase A1/A2